MENNTPYKNEMLYIQYEYDKAYYKWLFCPESEQKEAAWYLSIWRNKFFNN